MKGKFIKKKKRIQIRQTTTKEDIKTYITISLKVSPTTTETGPLFEAGIASDLI
jgi:hypothetical protein